MVRRLFSGLVILLVVSMVLLAGCCSHPVEVASLRDIEAKQDKYFGKYSAYVDADPVLKPAEKNDIKATLGAIHRQTTSVRRSIEGKD